MPLLTYGAQVWWDPKWRGQKWIIKELQGAQSRGVRWITGMFRTTPVGAMEMAAAVLPIKLSVNRLMHKAVLRTKALHGGHSMLAHLPEVWHGMPARSALRRPRRRGAHSSCLIPSIPATAGLGSTRKSR